MQPRRAAKLDGLWECILLLLHHGLSQLLVEWGRYVGPAVLLQAYRWIADSRDEFTANASINEPFPSLPLPHHHELHQDLSKRPEPGKGHCRDQEADGAAKALTQIASNQVHEVTPWIRGSGPRRIGGFQKIRSDPSGPLLFVWWKVDRITTPLRTASTAFRHWRKVKALCHLRQGL